jgi:hypothetical protein
MKIKTTANILAFLTIIILIVAISIISIKIEKEIDKEVKNYKNYIGKKIIVNNDTLIIFDYSMWNENFTLENGNKISEELIKKSKIIE